MDERPNTFNETIKHIWNQLRKWVLFVDFLQFEKVIFLKRFSLTFGIENGIGMWNIFYASIFLQTENSKRYTWMTIGHFCGKFFEWNIYENDEKLSFYANEILETFCVLKRFDVDLFFLYFNVNVFPFILWNVLECFEIDFNCCEVYHLKICLKLTKVNSVKTLNSINSILISWHFHSIRLGESMFLRNEIARIVCRWKAQFVC